MSFGQTDGDTNRRHREEKGSQYKRYGHTVSLATPSRAVVAKQHTADSAMLPNPMPLPPGAYHDLLLVKNLD